MRSFRSLSADTGMLAWLWLSAVVIFFDQWTKWWAEANLELHQPVAVMPHLNMMLAYNEGAAFSFLAGMGGVQRWIFATLAIVVSIFIINWLRKLRKEQVWAAVGLALVLGGAIGNLIDRLMHGKVIDFIDFYVNFNVPLLLNNGHFATFNVADIAITIGAVLLVVLSLFASDQIE
ncbi:MAG TPA: signal peptidase II [Candidatus Thiothrix moscowensis]|uniref:signal peptidase II n=1 Tax=unclassified Thiothrix TaxID=2636184 RepID=UPI001A198498|nr:MULTISPECIES: signal peptidase II [unclassified Thiothrix]MBJ6609538.1 signal peptidase II [Candidatus Thiothrix moscowensis]HRJ51474.1 signal peptidase II [Candidatus Thiothrix moscowensis]HRJ91471.1 signal peptidase II [Candidatus Thiothrix moscowensis]